MTKIRALKDSPLAKQGEVFESTNLNQYYDYFNICGISLSKERIISWIDEGWFEIVKEKKSLSEKVRSVYDKYMSIKCRDEIVTIAREHAIEIVKEANNEYNVKYFNGGAMDRSDYIIQKLEDKMR